MVLLQSFEYINDFGVADVGAVLFEKLFYVTFYCSSVALTAILWAYLGHKWVHGKSLNDDPNSH